MPINIKNDYIQKIILYNEDYNKNIKEDLIFYMHSFKPVGDFSYEFFSSTKDLKKDISFLINNLAKGHKEGYNKGCKILNKFKYSFYTHFPNDLIIKLTNSYNSFAKFKGLDTISDSFYTEMADANKLAVFLIENNNKIVSCQTYYLSYDKKISRLMHSFSDKSDVSKNDAMNISKWGYIKTWEELKKINIDTYDFGGLGTPNDTDDRFKNIIYFKDLFNGKKKIFYKGVKAITPKGKKVIEEKWGFSYNDK